MAFSKTMTKKTQLEGGIIVEEGTWDGTAVTTGNLTADTTEQHETVKIDEWFFTSDGDTEVYVSKSGVADNVLKMTFQSGDSGTYLIKGKAV